MIGKRNGGKVRNAARNPNCYPWISGHRWLLSRNRINNPTLRALAREFFQLFTLSVEFFQMFYLLSHQIHVEFALFGQLGEGLGDVGEELLGFALPIGGTAFVVLEVA